VDINGAKALKKRLGQNGADEAPRASAADVHEDAPPVFHWFGVSQPAPETPSADPDDASENRGVSIFRRLGLSFR
jgi:hypothetical protein